mgnify:CR=1 FL=1
MKILIVEDDPNIAEFIRTGFQSEGFIADVAENGQDGSYKARTDFYDVIILDYSLPIKTGIEVCDEIRGAGVSSPIIFLSVVGDTKKKIDALSKGADDYITKPFSFEELKARVKALLRRPKKIESATINVAGLTMDTEKKNVCRDDVIINLTRKEYNLLEYIMKNKGVVLSRSMIMEHVWSAERDPLSNTVEAHIANLRKKINTNDKKDIIHNVAGQGYVIEDRS